MASKDTCFYICKRHADMRISKKNIFSKEISMNMKRILSILLAVCACICVCAMLASCDGDEHEHTYKSEWSKDAEYHWHACGKEDCTEASERAKHTFDDGKITTEATAEADGVKTFTCTVCGQTKTESVKYVPEQIEETAAESIILTDPHRSNLMLTVYDKKGRLVEIWDVEDTLDWKYPYLNPLYSFEYGEDGMLTYYGGSTVSSKIDYDSDKKPYFVDKEINSTAISLESISYHENGSVKQIAFYLGTQLQTDTYDERGRIISAAWVNENGSKGEYRSEYKDNKQTITMLQNGELYDADIVIEYNSDGNPVKQITRMGENVSVDKEWTYNGKQLVSLIDRDSSKTVTVTYDENGLLVRSEIEENGELTEYTVFTYNSDGLRLSEKTYEANESYRSGYTYSYSGSERKTVTFEVIEGDDVRSVRVRDAYEKPISDTEYTRYEGEYSGEQAVYYGEYRVEYDGEGRIGSSTEITYVDIDGTKTKYRTESRRRSYVDQLVKNYEWSLTESTTYHISDSDRPSNYIDLARVYYYAKYTRGNTTYEREVNEATGEFLPEGDNKWKDDFGNYYLVENGERTDTIIYYQKYCDNNGVFYYFTADGVKTPLN